MLFIAVADACSSWTAGSIEQWCWPFLRQHGGSLELGSGRTDGAISEKLKNTNSKIADRRCTNLIVSLTAGGGLQDLCPILISVISAIIFFSS
jgi:hypothetical protein